jgi:succinyl-diaminopimelate desuccinylase
LETPSPTGEEGQVAGILYSGLERAGLEVEMREGNVVARRDEGKEETVILNGHMDTVAPLLPVKREGDIIYGRGAVDMKSALAGVIGAMDGLRKKASRYNIEVHFVTDEEGQSRGTWNLTREGVRGDLAVVCEPTDFDILLGQRGRAVLFAEIFGRAGHSSRAREKNNAIYLGCRAIEALKKIKARSHPDLGPGKITVTGFSSGGVSNVVPSRAELTMDRRLTIGEDEGLALRQVKDALDGIPSRVWLEERKTPISGPFLIEKNPLTEALRRNIQKKRPCRYGTTQATTDASYYVRQGIPAVIFGPGDPGLAHTEEEHINIKDVIDFKDILIGFLEES